MADPHKPLRDDVRLLGELLGETLRACGGNALFDTVERVRARAKEERTAEGGLSSLSGAHKTLFPQVVEQLRERDAGDILVFGGGVIPDADHETLKSSGIVMIFTPGTPLDEVTGWVAGNVVERTHKEGKN